MPCLWGREGEGLTYNLECVSDCSRCLQAVPRGAQAARILNGKVCCLHSRGFWLASLTSNVNFCFCNAPEPQRVWEAEAERGGQLPRQLSPGLFSALLGNIPREREGTLLDSATKDTTQGAKKLCSILLPALDGSCGPPYPPQPHPTKTKAGGEQE